MMFKLLLKYYENYKPIVFDPHSIYKAADVYNSDIVLGLPPTKPLHNFERFSKFLYNIDNKIIDSVRVIKYDMEGNLYILNLFNNTDEIIYIRDFCRNSDEKPKIDIYIGSKILSEESASHTIYYLETHDLQKIQIFFIINTQSFLV